MISRPALPAFVVFPINVSNDTGRVNTECRREPSRGFFAAGLLWKTCSLVANEAFIAAEHSFLLHRQGIQRASSTKTPTQRTWADRRERESNKQHILNSCKGARRSKATAHHYEKNRAFGNHTRGRITLLFMYVFVDADEREPLTWYHLVFVRVGR